MYLSALVLFVVYQVVNAWVPNADMILATRVLAVGFYATTLYVYGPDAWRGLVAPEPKKSDFLIVGIWISFASQLGQSVYSILYRLAPSQWFLNSEPVSWIVLASIVAAIMHVSAPGGINGTVPRRNRIALGIGVGFAAVAVAMLFTTRPDIGPLLERVKPFISDWWATGSIGAGISHG